MVMAEAPLYSFRFDFFWNEYLLLLHRRLLERTHSVRCLPVAKRNPANSRSASETERSAAKGLKRDYSMSNLLSAKHPVCIVS